MPTVLVDRAVLFAAIGREYTDEEFDKLCFEFGIELDDITSEGEMARRERGEAAAGAAAAAAAPGTGTEAVMYKIDVPANRYDILCVEGLARALRVFQNMQQPPVYRLTAPPAMLEVRVGASAAAVRPFLVSAVLRNIAFTPASYNSFLDLQDKLHQNICRRRTLVSIGTHDLDSIRGPFTCVPEARRGAGPARWRRARRAFGARDRARRAARPQVRRRGPRQNRVRAARAVARVRRRYPS